MKLSFFTLKEGKHTFFDNFFELAVQFATDFPLRKKIKRMLPKPFFNFFSTQITLFNKRNRRKCQKCSFLSLNVVLYQNIVELIRALTKFETISRRSSTFQLFPITSDLSCFFRIRSFSSSLTDENYSSLH